MSVETVKMRAEKLLFAEPNSEYIMKENEMKRGAVACLNVDRAEPWSQFVIVDYDGETIKYIVPRLRCIFSETNNVDAPLCSDEQNGFLQNSESLGKIEMGQDRTNEDVLPRQKCQCPPISQGMDLLCHCGASDINRQRYQTSFVPQTDIDYVVHKMANLNKHFQNYWPWIQSVQINMINDLDKQDGPHCCGES